MMSSSGSSGGSSGGGSSPCGACKFLRRKCIPGCIFAPYFDSEQGAGRFAAVHKIFGASNVSKLLLSIPVHKRLDAVVTISYEAQSRIRDPVYGCVSHLFALQQQVTNLQAEISYLHSHLAQLELPQPPPPPPQMATTAASTLSVFSMTDQPSATEMTAVSAATYDFSTLFDPAMMGQAASWAMQQRAMDPRLVHVTVPPSAATSAAMQAVARDIPHRRGPPPTSSSNASPYLSLSK